MSSFGLRNIRHVRDALGGDKLYRNVGGRFLDVSETAGIFGSEIAFGLGVAVGDVNHDGVRDVVLVDLGLAALEILPTLPGGDYVKATRFQVFQGKRFSDAPERRGEPREVLVGDVTDDGIDDIVLIVHDRLIVYPGQ